MTQPNDTYKTITSPAKGLFKDKGSKFLAFAYHVVDENEIKEHIASLKKEYFDARHHCYAWAIGPKREHTRAFDDGEPSGTAGKPILGQILSFDVTNSLIVVVRYFGGTLLGTGGLIQAYKAAASDALLNATLVEKTVNSIYKISFNYLIMNDIMRIMKEENVEQLSHEFDNSCNIIISVRNAKAKNIEDKLKRIESVQLDFLNFQ